MQLHTTTHLQSRSKHNFLLKLREIINAYQTHGFKVKHADADMEFEFLEESMKEMSFEIVAADDHEGMSKQSIFTVKEGVRCPVQQLPHMCTPVLMVKRLVQFVARNLNQLQVENSSPDEFSQLNIVAKIPPPEDANFGTDFGACAEAFQDNTTFYNTNRPRGLPATCIEQTPCRKPSQYSMPLVTGRRI